VIKLLAKNRSTDILLNTTPKLESVGLTGKNCGGQACNSCAVFSELRAIQMRGNKIMAAIGSKARHIRYPAIFVLVIGFKCFSPASSLSFVLSSNLQQGLEKQYK